MAEQKWFEGLRRQIKHRCGPGWGIDERHGGAKGFKKAIAALEEQGLGERLQVGTVWAFKASKPWP